MKRFISIVLSVAMVLTVISIPAFASDVQAATVYMDYDFENFTGAHAEVIAAAKNGATLTFNSNTYANTTVDDFAIDGDTGLRLVENTSGTRWFYVTLPQAITSGKMYLSFDVARMNHVSNSGGNAFICIGDSAVGATNTNIALRLNGAGIDSYDADTTKKVEMVQSAERTTISHIDQIYEIKNGTTVDIDTYIDGSLAGEKTLTVTNFKVINIQLTATVSYLDNLRISTMTDTSFAASIDGAVTTDDKYIDVKFTEGIGAGELTANSVTLTDASGNTVEVEKVEKYRGRTLRVYPMNTLKTGSYSVSVSSVSSITGKTYTTPVSFYAIAAPLYYNDMESTTDGKMNGAYSPGLITGYYGPDDYTAVKEEADGNHYIEPQLNNDNQRMSMTLNNPVSEGIMNIRFDVEVADDGASLPFRLQVRKEEDDTYLNLLAIDGGKIMTKNNQAYGQWGFAGPAKECTAGQKYTVDSVHNLSTGKRDIYVDGVLLQSYTDIDDAGKINRVHFQLSKDVTYLDNVRIAYMTDNSCVASYDPVFIGDTTVNLEFSETAVSGTLSSDSIALCDSEGNNITSSVSLNGYKAVITASEALSNEETYTVSFGNAQSVSGKVFKTVSITPVDSWYEVIGYSITDSNGDVIEDVSSLDANVTVTVNITIKNNNKSDKAACVLVGAYTSDGTVLDAASKRDVVLTGRGKIKVSQDIVLKTPADISNIYGYVWSDLSTCEPYVTAIPLK